MLVQCLSRRLIPLLLFASQGVSCLTQLPYPICFEEKKGSRDSGNSVMKEERNEPMIWDEPFWGAEEIAAECGMEPIMLPLCVAQRHRINVPADRNPQAVLAQISPIVLAGRESRLCRQIACAYESIIESACKVLVQYLLLKYASSASKVILDKIYNTYKSDLSDIVTYDKEVLTWKTKRGCTAKKPSGLVDTMEIIHSSPYSPYNAYDISTLTPGCSFSTVTESSPTSVEP